MPAFEIIDFSIFIIANLINLLISILFIFRQKKQEKIEYWLGLIVVFLALPIVAFMAINWIGNRDWWTFILLLPMVLYAVIELLFDYILKLEFRKTALLWPYLLIYYTALNGMIGYTFLVNRVFGFVTLSTYFINLFATWYGHREN